MGQLLHLCENRARGMYGDPNRCCTRNAPVRSWGTHLLSAKLGLNSCLWRRACCQKNTKTQRTAQQPERLLSQKTGLALPLVLRPKLRTFFITLLGPLAHGAPCASPLNSLHQGRKNASGDPNAYSRRVAWQAVEQGQTNER